MGYGSLDTCLRWERINCSTGMIATADTDERHSGKPESPDRIASNRTLPKGALYVMTLARNTAGINKAEDARRKDAQIGFADTLRRIFLTALANYLQFRDWIRQETLLDRSSVTFDVRQCATTP